jgi:hypothetical protein
MRITAPLTISTRRYSARLPKWNSRKQAQAAQNQRDWTGWSQGGMFQRGVTKRLYFEPFVLFCGNQNRSSGSVLVAILSGATKLIPKLKVWLAQSTEIAGNTGFNGISFAEGWLKFYVDTTIGKCFGCHPPTRRQISDVHAAP